jgi:hypothetical protein
MFGGALEGFRDPLHCDPEMGRERLIPEFCPQFEK